MSRRYAWVHERKVNVNLTFKAFSLLPGYFWEFKLDVSNSLSGANIVSV